MVQKMADNCGLVVMEVQGDGKKERGQNNKGNKDNNDCEPTEGDAVAVVAVLAAHPQRKQWYFCNFSQNFAKGHNILQKARKFSQIATKCCKRLQKVKDRSRDLGVVYLCLDRQYGCVYVCVHVSECVCMCMCMHTCMNVFVCM